MLSPYIHAALAHERHQEFLAQAETDRRAHLEARITAGERSPPPSQGRDTRRNIPSSQAGLLMLPALAIELTAADTGSSYGP